MKYREEDKIGTFSRRYTQKGDKNEEQMADFQTSYNYTSSLAIQLFSPYIIFDLNFSFLHGTTSHCDEDTQV